MKGRPFLQVTLVASVILALFHFSNGGTQDVENQELKMIFKENQASVIEKPESRIIRETGRKLQNKTKFHRQQLKKARRKKQKQQKKQKYKQKSKYKIKINKFGKNETKPKKIKTMKKNFKKNKAKKGFRCPHAMPRCKKSPCNGTSGQGYCCPEVEGERCCASKSSKCPEPTSGAGYMLFEEIQLAYGYDSQVKVSCGNHIVETCAQCGTQPEMCNGDCVWKGSKCVSKNSITDVSTSYFSLLCIISGCAPGLTCCVAVCLPICPLVPETTYATSVIGNDGDQGYNNFMNSALLTIDSEISNVTCSTLETLTESFSQCGIIQYGKCLLEAFYDFNKCRKETLDEFIHGLFWKGMAIPSRSNGITGTLSCLAKKLGANKGCKACTKRLLKAACCHFVGGKCCSNSEADVSGDPCCHLPNDFEQISNTTEFEGSTTTGLGDVTSSGAVTPYISLLCILGGCPFGLTCCAVLCLPICPLKHAVIPHITNSTGAHESGVQQYESFSKTGFLDLNSNITNTNCSTLSDLKNFYGACGVIKFGKCLFAAMKDILLCSKTILKQCSSTKQCVIAIFRCMAQKIYANKDCKQCGERLLKSICCHILGGKCCSNSKAVVPGSPCCDIIRGYSLNTLASLGSPDCDCTYHGFPSGGCAITAGQGAPKGYKCHCVYEGAWTCSGYAIGCDPGDSCPAGCGSKTCCMEGGGNCGGY